MAILDVFDRISEIKMEPLLSKGELVLDNWWERPEPKKEPFFRRHALFLLTFCLPVALAVLYFGFIASKQFESEARFLVRTTSHGDTANLASLMQNQKISRASDETFAVSDFIQSRDALKDLVANADLRSILSRPGADFLNRFPNFYSADKMEALYEHFSHFVDVHVDSESGIATLRVRAFTPDDAQKLAAALLRDAENLVNRLNARVFVDTLRLANATVEEERAKFVDVENQLTQYRNAQNVVDPGKESAVALDRLGKLMGSLMQNESSLSEEIAVAPLSPQIARMRDAVSSLREEIATQRASISGGDKSLVSKFSEFDRLMLDRELAARGLEAALAHAISARQDVEQQQYYLQTLVEPNLPDRAAYPRRALSILFVAGICFCSYWIVRAVLRNIREHQE
jgi:capsular polysaccharide transport system permease protein